MTPRDIVVIGASAGGIAALMELASGLPRELPAAVLIAVHSAPDGPGLLPAIVERAGPLPAAHAVDGERLRQGRIYIAPPDRHLLLDDGVVRVTRGPSENGFRPAVDALFRTAARSAGARVVGIVLSGALDDGSYGLQMIKRCGGVAIAQHLDDALVPSMPRSAMLNVDLDHVLPAREMPAVITRLATEPKPEGSHEMSRRGGQHDTAARGKSLSEETPPGPLSPFTCPECGGALWETRDGKLVRFNCHVGHRFTSDSLMGSHDKTVETAMWTALRALEEKSALRRHMAERAHRSRLGPVAETYERRAADTDAQAKVIRDLLMNGTAAAAEEPSTRPARLRPARKRSVRRGGRRSGPRRRRGNG